MKTIWTLRAVSSLEQILTYLKEKFSEKEARKFHSEVYNIIEKIAVHPKSFPVVREKNIRKAVIHKRCNLYYRIDDDSIILIVFFDTRQDPKKVQSQEK